MKIMRIGEIQIQLKICGCGSFTYYLSFTSLVLLFPRKMRVFPVGYLKEVEEPRGARHWSREATLWHTS